MKAIDGEPGHLPSTIFKRQGHADKNKERPNGDVVRAEVAPLAQGATGSARFHRKGRSLPPKETCVGVRENCGEKFTGARGSLADI